MIHDEATQRAVARLANNPDFKAFMEALEREQQSSLETLLSTLDTALVHQLQGATRILMDIKQAVTSAPLAVAQRNRNT